MFKFKTLGVAALTLCALQVPVWAQSPSNSVPETLPSNSPVTTNLNPTICPTVPGPPLPSHTSPIRSEPRLIPAPIPKIVSPQNTDTVTTPGPSRTAKPLPTPVPGVPPSPVPPALTKPITLDQALAIAFTHSPEIRIALDQVEKARGVINEANAHFLPTFAVQASSTVQGPTSSFQLSSGGPTVQLVPPTTSNIGLSFMLPLDISKRLAYSSDIATYQFQTQYLSMVTVSERLIENVKSAYYDLLRACGQRDVAQAAVDVAQLRTENTAAKQKAGTVALFDLTTAQVDLANLNQQLLTAQNNVYTAQAAFNKVLGININNPTQVVGSTVPVTISTVDIPKSTDTAFARRPEVKAAQMLIALDKKNIKLQKTGLLPSLQLSANTDYNPNATGLSPNALSWLATLSLSVPIWDGGVTKARVRQARADLQNSDDTLEQTKLSVAQEVRDAALNLQNAALRTQTTAQAVSLAKEALRLANVRYEAGIAVLVEVTNAESQLTQAQFNYVNAEYDYATALAQFQRATSSQPELDRLQLLTSPTRKSR